MCITPLVHTVRGFADISTRQVAHSAWLSDTGSVQCLSHKRHVDSRAGPLHGPYRCLYRHTGLLVPIGLARDPHGPHTNDRTGVPKPVQWSVQWPVQWSVQWSVRCTYVCTRTGSCDPFPKISQIAHSTPVERPYACDHNTSTGFMPYWIPTDHRPVLLSKPYMGPGMPVVLM